MEAAIRLRVCVCEKERGGGGLRERMSNNGLNEAELKKTATS